MTAPYPAPTLPTNEEPVRDSACPLTREEEPDHVASSALPTDEDIFPYPVLPIPTDREVKVASDSARSLSAYLQDSSAIHQFRITDERGAVHHMSVPTSLLSKLVDVMLKIARGDVVCIEKIAAKLTTFEAADLINVSHDRLLRLLDERGIPFRQNGANRQVNYTDMIELKKKIDAEDAAELAEMTRMSQEIEMG